MRSLFRLTAVALLAGGAVGCARLHARTASAGPPLEAPVPPPHVSSPVEEARAAEPPPVVVADPVEPPAPPPARPPAPPRSDRPQTVPTTPAGPPLPADATAAASPTPPPTLQTTANVEAVERKIRATLADATRGLGRIDYRGLSVEGKAQYDTAKRFVEQAEEALVAKNLLFASQLADKAAALAGLMTR